MNPILPEGILIALMTVCFRKPFFFYLQARFI